MVPIAADYTLCGSLPNFAEPLATSLALPHWVTEDMRMDCSVKWSKKASVRLHHDRGWRYGHCLESWSEGSGAGHQVDDGEETQGVRPWWADARKHTAHS